MRFTSTFPFSHSETGVSSTPMPRTLSDATRTPPMEQPLMSRYMSRTEPDGSGGSSRTITISSGVNFFAKKSISSAPASPETGVAKAGVPQLQAMIAANRAGMAKRFP